MAKLTVKIETQLQKIIGPFLAIAIMSVDDKPHTKFLFLFGKKVFEWKV